MQKLVFDVVNNAIARLNSDTSINDKNRFRMFITDGAAYMILAAELLKKEYNKLGSVTCVCHCLHLMCEKVKKHNSCGEEFIYTFKKVLSKSKICKRLFVQIFGQAPPTIIKTRWVLVCCIPSFWMKIGIKFFNLFKH